MAKMWTVVFMLVGVAAVADEPAPVAPETSFVATATESSSPKFVSGVATIMSGQETLLDIPTGLSNPVIFFGAVSETGKNAAGQQNPGVTVRSKLVTLEDGTKKFSVTAVTPHCDAMLNEETVEYFITNTVRREKDDRKKFYSITKKTISLGKAFDMGERVSVGDHGTSYLNCLAAIQTRNNEGYLVVQTDSEGLNKAQRDDSTYVRIRGSYYGIHERVSGDLREATADKSEDVALLCFQHNTGAIKDTAKGLDLKMSLVNTLQGPGVFALENDSDYPGTAVTGRLVGKHPYHIRSLGKVGGALSVFRITEDHCLNPDTFHLNEEVVVVKFKTS